MCGGMIDCNAVSALNTTIKGVYQITDSNYALLVTALMVPYAIFYIELSSRFRCPM